MALKVFPFPIPIFSPPSLTPTNPKFNTEIHFSRWNNANAREFEDRRRAQKQIEDDIRRTRRFNSATNIIHNHDPATEQNSSIPITKSVGTPSSPSAPSIPGRRSKYSKPVNHPAFQPILKKSKTPRQHPQPINRNAEVKLSEDGLSFVVDGAPFEFKYSYTETPKIKPIKLREPPFSPFGPTTMGRPWTGRAPLPASKKKLPEFDSFKLPPPTKKGVKPVQKPGPFLPGSGPRYVYSREQILGEPLTKEEIKELVESCIRTRRQLNMGRDGFTHNMLDNIHALWKRRRVCKIKCIGVCTVDMDNVCQQLEERTGGKVIYRKSGVVFLFRGRNYNHRTRPRFPLMLWKPNSPVYPRLVKRVPEGLTLREATEMRRKGRELTPICKLAKNGVYCNLVSEVREAFGECELVRIDCQKVKGSDYRKVGAKLKDLVPCVLISFENDHLLMWRGKDWKSSLPVNESEESKGFDVDIAGAVEPVVDDQITEMVSHEVVLGELNTCEEPVNSDEQADYPSKPKVNGTSVAMDSSLFTSEMCENDPGIVDTGILAANESEVIGNEVGNQAELADVANSHTMSIPDPVSSVTVVENVGSDEKLDDALLNQAKLADVENTETMPIPVSVSSVTMVENVGSDEKLDGALLEQSKDNNKSVNLIEIYADGVLWLREQAINNGSAVILADEDLDADTVYQRAVAFAKSAPPDPVFKRRPRKVYLKKSEKLENNYSEAEEVLDLKDLKTTISQTIGSGRRSSSSKPEGKKRSRGHNLDSAPPGRIGVDELAKLLG